MWSPRSRPLQILCLLIPLPSSWMVPSSSVFSLFISIILPFKQVNKYFTRKEFIKGPSGRFELEKGITDLRDSLFEATQSGKKKKSKKWKKKMSRDLMIHNILANVLIRSDTPGVTEGREKEKSIKYCKGLRLKMLPFYENRSLSIYTAHWTSG